MATQDLIARSATTTQPPSVRDTMDQVVRTSGMEAALAKAGSDEQDELKNVEELISAAAEYDENFPGGSLVDFLAQIQLQALTDRVRHQVGFKRQLGTLAGMVGRELSPDLGHRQLTVHGRVNLCSRRDYRLAKTANF